MTKEPRVEPWGPGARITWSHCYPDGRIVRRAGTVWDRGPSTDGAVIVAWVIPDERLPGDIYLAIPVGKATRNLPSGGEWGRGAYVSKGDAFSSSYTGSPLGVLAAGAARHARGTA